MQKQTPKWLTQFVQAQGTSGVIALAWWIGARHAVEIRELEGSFPFLRIIHSAPGPCVLLKTLSTLSGSPAQSHLACARFKPGALNQALFADTNLPLVLEEMGGPGDDFSDWDMLKPLFNNATRREVSRTVDPRHSEQTFARGLVFVTHQNDGPALPCRTVRLVPDESNRPIARKLAFQELLELERLGDVLALSPTAWRQMIYRLGNTQSHIEAVQEEIGKGLTHRHAKNHAQLIALVYAIADIFCLPEDECARAVRDIHDMAYESLEIPF